MKHLLAFCLVSSVFVWGCNTSKDADGNSYKTITLDRREWMAENLNVSHYRNGDLIPNIQDSTEWANATTGAWCYYENNSAQGKVYGRLYNWYAVNDPRGLAPEGWRIPSQADWNNLIYYSGGYNTAGKVLKAKTGWDKEGSGTDEHHFAAMPSGARDGKNGTFRMIGTHAFWWSTSEDSIDMVWTYMTAYNVNRLGTNTNKKRNGFSVRCVRDLK